MVEKHNAPHAFDNVANTVEPSEPSEPSRPFMPPALLYYNEIDERGHVCKYKIESGLPVFIQDLGDVKTHFNRAIERASIMTPDQASTLNIADMSHIEIAAFRVAQNASQGCLRSTQELLDRVLGKSKQVSESTNVNLSIDDILNGIPNATTYREVEEDEEDEEEIPNDDESF